MATGRSHTHARPLFLALLGRLALARCSISFLQQLDRLSLLIFLLLDKLRKAINQDEARSCLPPRRLRRRLRPLLVSSIPFSLPRLLPLIPLANARKFCRRGTMQSKRIDRRHSLRYRLVLVFFVNTIYPLFVYRLLLTWTHLVPCFGFLLNAFFFSSASDNLWLRTCNCNCICSGSSKMTMQICICNM